MVEDVHGDLLCATPAWLVLLEPWTGKPHMLQELGAAEAVLLCCSGLSRGIREKPLFLLVCPQHLLLTKLNSMHAAKEKHLQGVIGGIVSPPN